MYFCERGARGYVERMGTNVRVLGAGVDGGIVPRVVGCSSVGMVVN